jgi:hypothetical protein
MYLKKVRPPAGGSGPPVGESLFLPVLTVYRRHKKNRLKTEFTISQQQQQHEHAVHSPSYYTHTHTHTRTYTPPLSDTPDLSHRDTAAGEAGEGGVVGNGRGDTLVYSDHTDRPLCLDV